MSRRDGGGRVHRRPVRGQTYGCADTSGWKSLDDGWADALRCFAVAIGADTCHGGFAVTGGRQDNGLSLPSPVKAVMGSNLGGDGGDPAACRRITPFAADYQTLLGRL